jgi:hypothetical protein
MRYPEKKKISVKFFILLLICFSRVNSEIIRFAPEFSFPPKLFSDMKKTWSIGQQQSNDQLQSAFSFRPNVKAAQANGNSL